MSCPRCGADNQCGAAAIAATSGDSGPGCTRDQQCWCFQVQLTADQRTTLPQSAACYCAACLDVLVRDIQS